MTWSFMQPITFLSFHVVMPKLLQNATAPWHQHASMIGWFYVANWIRTITAGCAPTDWEQIISSHMTCRPVARPSQN